MSSITACKVGCFGRFVDRDRARLSRVEVRRFSVCDGCNGAFQNKDPLIRPGWDAIFEYQGETYAEMDQAKKNGLSHRFLALAKFKDWLAVQPSSWSA